MGFNTVAFLLNDYMHHLKDSPKSVTTLLTSPPMGSDPLEQKHMRHLRDSLPESNSEPRVHDQALEILPTFHADEHRIFMAGGNCIVRLEAIRFGKTKEGKRTITLELPGWFNDRSGHCWINMKSKR